VDSKRIKIELPVVKYNELHDVSLRNHVRQLVC